MALGANRGSVVWLMVARGARLAAFGLLIGLSASLGLAHLLAGLVFGVSAYDPPTFVLSGLFLFLAAVAAAYLPARRASESDPITALRAD